jgi:signal transduction histidine kinase/CheY-like chemotaxis protein
MAALMRRHDWQASPLGPPQHWPETLKVAMRILLTSRFEMWLGWGPDIAFFYNDAYRPTLGNKHPRALGTPARELWAEIWDDVKDRMETVYRDGRATWDKALLLLLERSGYPEETYHTFSYSPLLGDTGQVEGLFCAVSEETDRVISERRLATLSRLSAALARADSRQAVFGTAADALGHATRDLPFTLSYLFDADGAAHLAAVSGIAPGHALAVQRIDAGSAAPWAADRIRAGERSARLALDADAHPLPTGAWDKPPQAAVVVPIDAQGGEQPAGFMVAALNPYRPFDDDYLSFIQLLAGQVASSLASADAYDMARRRSEQLAEAVRLRQQASDVLREANAHLAAEVEARTAERDRLRELFQQAPGFMCVMRGPQHVFELVNESYLQLVGHRSIVGRQIREALPEIAGQGFFELLDEVLRSGRPYVGRGVSVMLQRQPGAALEERFLNFVYQPTRAPDGSVNGIFAEGSDVTEQIHAERALIALNETLEQRITERTGELGVTLERLRAESAEREAVQEALRQSQKMEAVGQLTGGIAHDFNNLLQGITGSLELVRRRLEQGRVQEVERFIGDATGSARRAAALTHRLLAFSRRQPLDPKPVKANPLIASMEDLLRRTLGERIALELVLAGGLWITLCDANQLESAVLNLCINARDAMPHGGRLTIETGNAHLDRPYAARADITPGQYVCISVTDTGTGMTPDVASRAFDPFFTTKPIGQGTGLGLSMIYGFTRQSEGHAKIYTEPGKGTSVKLYLPRWRGEAAADEETSHAAEAHATEHSETVLVIEDEAVVRGLIVEILNDLGYRPIEAADGPSGLDILKSPRKIDLLVTDIGLPGLNGRQVADAARLSRPDLKVLFMTGYAENAAFAGGFLEPGMEMMTKPFAMDALAMRLRDMMQR